MLSDLIKEEFEPKLLIAVYLGGALITMSIMASQYYMGFYLVFLSNLFILLSFIFGAAYVYILRNQRSFFYVAYPVTAILGLVTLFQIVYNPDQGMQFFYITPIFFFFYLPLKKTLGLGLLVALLSLIVIALDQNFKLGLRISLQYLFILGAGYFFVSYLLEKQNRLKEKSVVDPVSRAYKQSHYKTLLDRELLRSRSDNHELSLIGIVIGDYDQLQELHGRKALIQFLPKFVAEIQNLVRVADDVFRIEDDKFIIVLTHCPEDGANVLMGRIMNSLQKRQWPPFADIILMSASVTLSSGESDVDLNARLDKKLAKQKRSSKTISAIEPDISAND